MKNISLFKITFLFLIFCTSAIAADFIVLIHSGINIRTQPNAKSVVINQASKGQLYRYVGEMDEFYKIKLFTDEIRYISKSLSAQLTESQFLPGHNYKLPSNEKIIPDILNRIQKAKELADIESEEIIPKQLSKERNNVYKKILEDRYILTIFQNFEIHPALYKDLKERGEKNEY